MFENVSTKLGSTKQFKETKEYVVRVNKTRCFHCGISKRFHEGLLLDNGRMYNRFRISYNKYS